MSNELVLVARDPALRLRWERWLNANGWSVVPASAQELPRLCGAGRSAAALVDSTLVQASQLAALREGGAERSPFILFGRGGASDDALVRWLEAGADDFIPDSIAERVLLAKLQALARRSSAAGPAPGPSLWSPQRTLKVDPDRGLAWTKARGGRWRLTPPLTDTESRLLQLFLAHPGATLERGFILQALWGERAEAINEETLTKHVESLRAKLDPFGSAIRTLYGRGYFFLEEP